MRTFAAPFEKRALTEGIDKFIEKTEFIYTVQEASTEKIQFIEKR